MEIKIKFTDFWEGFDVKQSIIFKTLSKKHKVILSEEPDYLFFSVFGDEHLNYNNCIKIFYTGEEQSPDFNLCDYAIGFDYINFEDRYIRFPVYLTYPYYIDYNKMLKKKKVTKKDLIKKKVFCTFVYSNENADKKRNEFFLKLSKYKKILSGGKILNNIGYLVDNKESFQKGAKFSIAFENASKNGYTTEKIVQSFCANTIPIYWGDSRIIEVFNQKAFINVHNYKNIDEVIEYIKEIDNNDDLYLKIVNEKPLINKKESLDDNFKHLENFLEHIISQEKEKAYRRTLTAHNELYYKKIFDYYNKRNEFYKMYKYNYIYRIYKKIFIRKNK